MDPAHVPYAHYGLMRFPKPKGKYIICISNSCFNPFTNLQILLAEKIDREGGKPLEINVKKLDNKGFFSKQEWGYSNFIAPCVYRSSTDPLPEQEHEYPAPAASDKVIDFNLYQDFLV